jgi:hypothetical protein
MYTLEGRKCGTIRFEPTTTGVVNSEDVTRSSTITDNPVEGGSNIQDHVFHQPLSFQISGVAINGADTISALQKMWKSGDIITYTGRNRIENLVIQQLRSTHDAAHKTGFSFTATLKQITLGSSEGSGTSTMVEQDTAAAASLPASTSKAVQKTSSQTAKTRADGLKTTVSTSISASAYASYVDSFNSKPDSSAGPTSRATPTNTGRR